MVIARDCVAKEYAGIMTSLDVGIGAHKSLISTTGKAMEFAKRTFLNGVNVSMVPFAEFVVGRQSLAGLLELTRKYSLSFGQMLSVLGYGYRAKASASKRLFSLPKRLRNYIVTFYGPGGPGYKGLKGWLPLKSVTSLYKTSVTRVHGLCKLFFESEIRLILEYLDSYSDLIAAAKRLGTVYRDREHYGTVSRGADRASKHPGIEATTPSEVVDSLNETVYREAFLDSVIAARDLRTKLEELSLGQPQPPVMVAEPTDAKLIDGEWRRPQTLEEYNASLERAWSMDRSPNPGPWTYATEVPKNAFWVPTAAPQFVSAPQAEQPSSTGVDLDWEGLESLWTQFREIETAFASLPFPRNIQTRVSEGKPPTSESKMLKRWYRYSSTFRATVDPVN
nr:MAG: RNA-dependent RNA polymerase [Mitovirus sp.]